MEKLRDKIYTSRELIDYEVISLKVKECSNLTIKKLRGDVGLIGGFLSK